MWRKYINRSRWKVKEVWEKWLTLWCGWTQARKAFEACDRPARWLLSHSCIVHWLSGVAGLNSNCESFSAGLINLAFIQDHFFLSRVNVESGRKGGQETQLPAPSVDHHDLSCPWTVLSQHRVLPVLDITGALSGCPVLPWALLGRTISSLCDWCLD